MCRPLLTTVGAGELGELVQELVEVDLPVDPASTLDLVDDRLDVLLRYCWVYFVNLVEQSWDFRAAAATFQVK